MAKKDRLTLQAQLEELLGSRNVYFQPPSTVRISYPAIVYELSSIRNVYADNSVYAQTDFYQLTAIDKNPDSELFRKLSQLPGCRFVRAYKADNLNHTVFVLYN